MSKSITISIIVAVLAAVVVGTIVLNPFSQSGNTVNNALGKTLLADSFQEEGELKVGFTLAQGGNVPAGIQQGEVTLSFSEKVASSDAGNPKSSSDINLNIMAGGMSMKVAGKIKMVDKTLYAQITQVPPTPFVPSSITDQWFKVDLKDLQKSQQGAENIDQKKIVKEVRNLLTEKKIFKVEKNLGKDEQGKHFKISFSKKAVREIIPGLAKIVKENVASKNQKQMEKELKEFENEFNKNFEQTWKFLSPLRFEVWVGQNGYLRKFKFQKEVTDFGKEMKALKKLDINLNFSLDNFGKEFTIEKPSNAKPLKDLNLQELLSPSQTSSQQTPTMPNIPTQ